jgi:hypothetical protein
MFHGRERLDSGMSLVEAVVAIGLFGFVTVAGVNVLVNYSRTNSKVSDMGEVYDLRQYVRNSIDCGQTFSNPASIAQCSTPTGGPIDVFGASGNLLISKTDGKSVLFDYQLRSRCVTNNGIFELGIDYIPMTDKGAAKKDALTKSTGTWRTLTDNIPLVCRGAGQLIFSYRLPKTATRSRELFSDLCTKEAQRNKIGGTYKAVISLSPRYKLAPDDVGKPMNAVDYAAVYGSVINAKGEIVSSTQGEFWSIKHSATIMGLADKVVYPVSHSTGSSAEGRYVNQCASDDVNGNFRGCNCDNLQVTDGGHGKRFSGGHPDYSTPTANWAYSLVNRQGNTVCTFNHFYHPPTYIYCLQQ